MSQSYKPKKSSQEVIFTVLSQISYTKLFKKYTSGNFSFNKICINNLIFNENCLVVSRFKDFLIYDDNTEFFRKFYPIKDSFPKLEHILNFYEKYSKIFPNYLVLKENKYLYRNIRKKQKMIDALNELKREERENRKKLKTKEYSKDKRSQGSQLNELFTKNIKKEIKNYQKNISFQNYKNSFDSDTDKNNEDTLLINQNSMSIYNKQLKEEKENKCKDEINAESFVTNQTNGSISNIVNVLNDNKIYISDLPNILVQNNNSNKNTQNNKKPSGKKDSNHNSVKAFNRNSNKEEIEFQPKKHIRNNSLIKRKKIADKNNLYKNALTSTNATNSSSILSKKIKNQQTSPVNRATKDNIKKRLENNNDKNLYQKTTPNFSHFELSKNNKQANNNESKKNEDKTDKENIQINKANNLKKEKCKINKEIVKKKNQSPSTKKNKETYNISNNPKSQRVIIHSSSSGNLISKFTQNYNNNDQNIKQEDTFINIEDLLLLEDKFCDVIYALNNKSSNLSNTFFELLNFYNNSSLYNKFENYYKNPDYKSAVHKVILLLMYNIILCYNISFDRNFLITSNDVLSTILILNHKSYLILCEYINSKISSSALGNTWVKKLKNMLFSKLEHINMNNREYIQFLINQHSNNNIIDNSNSIFEIKFYSYSIEKYLRVLLKNFSNDKLNEDFVKIFKNIESISPDELNNFFRKKVVRVLNKNASVLGSDLPQNEINVNPIRIPYLNKESIKEFSLVLDLDETLISFKVDENDDSKGILRFRPGLDYFLNLVSKYYELIIFTAATKEYADPILDAIETNQLYFDYRLYRQHTIVYNNDFIKDLSKLGRNMSKVIIVDNMPQNFRLQKENGIFIKAFWGEDNYDTALYDLGNILEKIALEYKDLRKGLVFYKDDILNKVTSNFARKDIHH